MLKNGTDSERHWTMYTQLGLYIDGQWHNGNGGGGEDVINPATEKALAHLPRAGAAELDQALEAARKGFAVWRATSAYDRARIMRKAADLMRERHDAISKILTLEQGKVYAESRAEARGRCSSSSRGRSTRAASEPIRYRSPPRVRAR